MSLVFQSSLIQLVLLWFIFTQTGRQRQRRETVRAWFMRSIRVCTRNPNAHARESWGIKQSGPAPLQWHPQPLIGSPLFRRSAAKQTGMCEKGFSVCCARPRFRRRSSIARLDGRVFSVGSERFTVFFQLHPEGQRDLSIKATPHLFLFLRMDGEARGDGRTRRWAAARVKFCRGELKPSWWGFTFTSA